MPDKNNLITVTTVLSAIIYQYIKVTFPCFMLGYGNQSPHDISSLALSDSDLTLHRDPVVSGLGGTLAITTFFEICFRLANTYRSCRNSSIYASTKGTVSSAANTLSAVTACVTSSIAAFRGHIGTDLGIAYIVNWFVEAITSLVEGVEHRKLCDEKLSAGTIIGLAPLAAFVKASFAIISISLLCGKLNSNEFKLISTIFITAALLSSVGIGFAKAMRWFDKQNEQPAAAALRQMPQGFSHLLANCCRKAAKCCENAADDLEKQQPLLFAPGTSSIN